MTRISTAARVLAWLFVMFVMGVITLGMAYAVRSFDSGTEFLLLAMPFAAGLLTMLIWGVLQLRVGTAQQMAQVRDSQAASHKAKRADSDRLGRRADLARLIEQLDEDTVVELETLLHLRRDEV